MRQKAAEGKTHREGERVRNREGKGSVCVPREATEQEKTSVPWEHSDGLSKALLCSHCWSASQN